MIEQSLYAQIDRPRAARTFCRNAVFIKDSIYRGIWSMPGIYGRLLARSTSCRSTATINNEVVVTDAFGDRQKTHDFRVPTHDNRKTDRACESVRRAHPCRQVYSDNLFSDTPN